MSKISYVLFVVLCGAALLVGCNFPSKNSPGVQTAAALTVQAELTASAPPTPTNTAVPFPTLPPVSTPPTPANTLPPAATATPRCDSASFVTDVTIPDNTDVSPGDNFTKTWRLKNIGTCSWTPTYATVFVNGTAMGGPSVQALAGNVNPGQTVDISIDLTAPTVNGTYTGNYGLRNSAGVIFTHFFVQIVVSSGTGGPFAVIHVTYDLSTWGDATHTNCPLMTAHITTNGTGDVQYHWTYSDNSAQPVQTVHFDSAGTKDVQAKWALPSSSNGQSNWLGIYVDSPNHQDFNHKTFTTACTSP